MAVTYADTLLDYIADQVSHERAPGKYVVRWGCLRPDLQEAYRTEARARVEAWLAVEEQAALARGEEAEAR